MRVHGWGQVMHRTYRIEFYLLLTRLAGHRLAPLRSELPSACRNRLMVVEAVHKLMAL